MLNDKYKNRGLGRFCMAYLVRKLLSKGMGNYKVMSPSLSQQDAKSEDEKLLRNNFYKKSGFQFSNINIAGGRCSAPSIASLVPKHNRSKVKVIDKERLGKLLLANLDKTSKLTKNIVGLENALTYSKYSVKAVEQKYSVSIFLSMWLSIYAIWTLPFIDDIGKLVFSFLFAAASYVFCFQDVKVWVLDKLKRLTQ
ncbi:Putative uncharacterized protein [Moritella viscosa]|uniref:hypothetical protein n=1 Tax=Moritella viscosa TaxID=80854 RepID=UPI00050924D4|nr:hypothetical protein [Moritella viscosa]CED58355.1 membrane protein [Moritella viscosa]SHN95965.1 Putative uncharacterized protein [Moritella viscosa]SHO19278.1 Putative uncharacterized protein [Moritella viscosa]